MGRRRQNLTSVARYVKAMEPPPTSTRPPAASPHEFLDTGNSEPALGERECEVETRPSTKKRKITLLDSEFATSNVTDLVPQYSSLVEVPQHLKKYFAQRHRYFSLYDSGCLLDEEGWYSVTPEKVAQHIAERCRCDTVLDAFCGVGGNAIAFAQTCQRVIAIDTSPLRLALARHNAIVYGVADRIEFILADYLDFARSYSYRPPDKHIINVVFLSPPWGGPAYLNGAPQLQNGEDENNDSLPPGDYSLEDIRPIPGDELFRLTRRITENVAYYLPRNVDLQQVSNLVKQDSASDGKKNENLVNTQRVPEKIVEVEENYMSGKLKAVTCYFGGLAHGQEDMF